MSTPHDPTASAPASAPVRRSVVLAAHRDAHLGPLRVLIARASPGGDLYERAWARWEARERCLDEVLGVGAELP